MATKISISVKGIDSIKALLERVPVGAKSVVAYAVGIFLLGDASHGLKHYAPYRHVTRKQAYGRTFQSSKQQRAFFAKLKSGEIGVPYHRTGKQGAAWHLSGNSTNVRLRNTDPTVQFTRGQTRLHGKMGWQTAMQTVKSNMAGALKKGKEALLKFIKGK